MFLLHGLKYMTPQEITKAIQTNRTSRTPTTMPMMPPVETEKSLLFSISPQKEITVASSPGLS